MLVRAGDFNSVGGFSENYVYGCEDVDFCLKLKTSSEISHRVVINELLCHDEMTTRSKIPSGERRGIFDRNHEILKLRWHSTKL